MVELETAPGFFLRVFFAHNTVIGGPISHGGQGWEAVYCRIIANLKALMGAIGHGPSWGPSCCFLLSCSSTAAEQGHSSSQRDSTTNSRSVLATVGLLQQSRLSSNHVGTLSAAAW